VLAKQGLNLYPQHNVSNIFVLGKVMLRDTITQINIKTNS